MGLRSTSEALAYVDDLGPSATGELVVAGPEGCRGALFVEEGRVCWAAARGLARRLSALLSARAGLATHEMEVHYLACRERQVPLGEHLVEEGVLSADALRAALLEHSLESVSVLCANDASPVWCPRRHKGYSPRFTFATSELLANAGARTYTDEASRLRPVLTACFGDTDWAAAFVRSATSGAPELVATSGQAPASSTALLRLGRWGASVLDVVAVFARGDGTVYSVSRTPSTCLVVFREERGLVVGETAACGRILNRRAQERRAKGPI